MPRESHCATSPAEPRATRQRLLAYAVHVYTVSGIVFAFLAAAELLTEACDPRRVFLWLLAAIAIDGPLARWSCWPS